MCPRLLRRPVAAHLAASLGYPRELGLAWGRGRAGELTDGQNDPDPLWDYVSFCKR